MGYLNKETVTIDAILTKKGRELLAAGRSAFQITKFAVADDEIDYGLYDPSHPLGTEYYGSAIENMPIVEASPDETQNLKYKLVSLDPGTLGIDVMPVLSVAGKDLTGVTLEYKKDVEDVIFVTTSTGTTSGLVLDGPEFGYTAVIYNSDAADIDAIDRLASDTQQTPVYARSLSGNAKVVQAQTGFRVIPKNVSTVTTTQVVITGNQSGATTTISYTINPATTTTV